MCSWWFASSASFVSFIFFFFNDTATTEIYTLSLHDALPISFQRGRRSAGHVAGIFEFHHAGGGTGDRKSTRLNSSHMSISYAVFCLKKKKKQIIQDGLRGRPREHAFQLLWIHTQLTRRDPRS